MSDSTLPTSPHFQRLLDELLAMGEAATVRPSEATRYREFIERFPLERLDALTLDEYCVGKGNREAFCWWLERGLEPVLGRYMPGTSRGHYLYFEKDGSVYKPPVLAGLADEDALRIVLAVQATIVSAAPDADWLWVDDDAQIYRRAGVAQRFPVAPGRKLRLLSAYHPEAVVPISSSEHVGHFLEQLGWPAEQIPPKHKPVARMQLLRQYLELARESIPALSTAGFMRGLYAERLGLAPVKEEKEDADRVEASSGGLSGALEEGAAVAATARNQILYGPPGTGKTYQTIEAALAIIAPALLTGTPDRSALKAAFDRHVAAGRIAFTTFHQSFSYEDFVEGLRATSRGGQIDYTVEPGVFKRLCERAAQGVAAQDDPFDQALARLQEKLEQNDGRVEMRTAKGKSFAVSYSGGSTFQVYPASNEGLKAGYSGNMDYVRRLYNGADSTGMYNQSYVKGMLSYLQAHCGLPTSVPQRISSRGPQPFVLVIDEINRGNVSRIFGELITLIEPSKRAGRAEALEVILPYSKDSFSVPDNLHIIGTMNTADRSLAGLDIALRRRFEFVEMPPQPELLDDVRVEDIPIGELLRVMNARIEVLLDRDHCLGHAYFMPLRDTPTLEMLARIFRNNVLPLLQEYFFEDWQRIAWVFNDHRKPPALRFLIEPAMDFDVLFGEGTQVNRNGLRWAVNAEAFALPGAYAGIIAANGAEDV